MKKVLFSNFGIYPDKKLIIEVHKGIGGYGCMMNFKNIEIEHKDYSKEYNIITDLGDVTFAITTNQIKNFAAFLIDEEKKQNAGTKTAIIINSPNQSIYSTIFQTHETEFEHPIAVFKTIEEASKWIDNDLDLSFIKKEIKNLKAKTKIKFEVKTEF